LLDLLDRIGTGTDPAPETPVRGDVHARIDRARITGARAALTNAPLGGPVTLAAVAALLPCAGATDAAAAVGAYVAELTAAFDVACAQPPETFAAYLSAQPAAELDAARAVAIAVLDARAELTSR
jgi:hypothetical protein